MLLPSSRTVVGLLSLVFAAGCGLVIGEGDVSPRDEAGRGAATTPGASPGAKPGTTPSSVPDGTAGVCCPASTGGCALIGGYSATGRCDGAANGRICDNMCEQRIVAGEHGCPTLTYKSPPVSTTYAGVESCSDPVFNGGRGGPAPTGCTYPAVQNDPRCPATYSHTLADKTCPAVGLVCRYPGAGDGAPCPATAMLWCYAGGDAGFFQLDGGPDAGPGVWTAAQ